MRRLFDPRLAQMDTPIGVAHTTHVVPIRCEITYPRRSLAHPRLRRNKDCGDQYDVLTHSVNLPRFQSSFGRKLLPCADYLIPVWRNCQAQVKKNFQEPVDIYVFVVLAALTVLSGHQKGVPPAKSIPDHLGKIPDALPMWFFRCPFSLGAFLPLDGFFLGKSDDSSQ